MHFRHSGCAWPGCPQRKHTSVLISFGQVDIEMPGTGGSCCDGFEELAISSVYLERGMRGFEGLVVGLQNTLLLFKVVSWCSAVCEEAQKASLAMRFSLQRITASYHCLGISSEGRPEVRQATWS